MKRYAILIASPNLKDHYPLPGTQVDVRKLREWLISNQGGAWESNEIKTFVNPSHIDLKPCLAHQAVCDYAFTAFAGHGFMEKADYGHETVVCLRDGEDLRVKNLNPGNPRFAFLADCCRNLSVDIPSEMIKKSSRAAASHDDNRKRCRALFDTAVLEAEQGAVYLYSCDKNETAADDDDDGGLFTFNLLNSGADWASRQARNAVLRLDEVFTIAQARTTEMVAQQHPQMQTVRRLVHFPFVVT